MKNGRTETFVLIFIILVTVFATSFVMLNKSRVNKESNMPVSTSVPAEGRSDETQIIQESDTESGLSLEITSPRDGITLSASTVKVSGQTEPAADIFINDLELKADASGNFEVNLPLEEGDNVIVITASDEAGNYSEKSLTVTFEPAG